VTPTKTRPQQTALIPSVPHHGVVDGMSINKKKRRDSKGNQHGQGIVQGVMKGRISGRVEPRAHSCYYAGLHQVIMELVADSV